VLVVFVVVEIVEVRDDFTAYISLKVGILDLVVMAVYACVVGVLIPLKVDKPDLEGGLNDDKLA